MIGSTRMLAAGLVGYAAALFLAREYAEPLLIATWSALVVAGTGSTRRRRGGGHARPRPHGGAEAASRLTRSRPPHRTTPSVAAAA